MYDKCVNGKGKRVFEEGCDCLAAITALSTPYDKNIKMNPGVF